MIGKSAWFKKRIYGGWGLTPKSWEGWAYITVMIGIFAVIQLLPLDNAPLGEMGPIKLTATLAFAAIFILDILHIMATISMDERERVHEAKADRNALWVMLTILIADIIWQSTASSMNHNVQIDPIIIIALLGGVITKAITSIYLERKN